MEYKLSNYALGAPADPLMDIFQQAGKRGAAMAAEGKELISLAVGAPDNAMLHLELEKQLHDAALEEYGPGALNYRFTNFEPAMQKFLESRGLVFNDNIGLHATSGGMEAITLGVRSLIEKRPDNEKRDVVLAESPGFTGTLSVLAQAGAEIIQIPCGMEGIDPQALEEAIIKHHPKLISLMPDNQNPTGAVMPVENRKAIAKLLQKYGVLAIEDGAYSELRAEGEALPPLQSFAPEHVLYATSFSKILWPAIRIGVLVAAKEITTATARMKFNDSMVAPTTNLAMAERFITNDSLVASRLQEIRSVYRERRDAMLAALEKSFPKGSGYEWTHPTGGMFLWLTAPETVNMTEMFEPALAKGVVFVPGSKCYAQNNTAPHNTARLNFASSSPDKIREGIARFAMTVSQ
jgi:2-aminoadipate transaminase